MLSNFTVIRYADFSRYAIMEGSETMLIHACKPRSRSSVIATEIVVILLICIIHCSAQSSASRGENPLDRKIADLDMEQRGRIDQRDLILAEEAAIGKAAKPLLDEQESLKTKAAPFIAIEASIEARGKNLETRIETHTSNCHSGPLDPQPFKTCTSEHSALDQEAKNIKIDLDYNDNNLRPLRARYAVIESQLDPYLKAYRSLVEKREAIEREIVRIDRMIKGLNECKTITNCPPGGCSQMQLEFMKLCEDIKWAGAEPKLLLRDKALAALDPRLPPRDWKPPRFTFVSQ